MKRHLAASLCCALLAGGGVCLADAPSPTAKLSVPVAAPKAQSNVNRSALNPQPLPPGPPDPEKKTAREPRLAKEAAAKKKSIIIVGGKTATP